MPYLRRLRSPIRRMIERPYGSSPLLEAALLVSALLGSAALAGCTPAPQATVFVTASPEPAATVYVTPTPAPSVTRPPNTGTNVEQAPIEPNAPAVKIEEGPAVDLGARDGAQGAPGTNDAGELSTYTVVSGDSFFDIAQRFDLPQQQLLRMNPSIPDLGQTLYIGQVVNIDWTTTR